jgi:iron complex outermembrane recepter protein
MRYNQPLGQRPGRRHPVMLRRGLSLASAISAVLSGAAPAVAADEPTLENIIVTAQKREENLQNVPISIQAIDTEKLEQLHVQSFDDYAQYLPSVAFTTVGPGFAAIYFRGVASGENSNHSGPLPSVGVYLDEQPVTTITGPLDIHIYDIARVEALAGPQGTLYGASSQSGTLRIITNKPDPGGFKAGYDLGANAVSGGDLGETIEGFVNLPLSSTTAIRLVGWQEHDAGYVDNVHVQRTYPSSGITDDNTKLAQKDYNPVDIVGGRAALRVNLDENWTITPMLMSQEERTQGIFAEDSTLGNNKVGHFFGEDTKDTWWQAALTVEGKVSNLDVVYAGAYLNREVHEKSDYSDYSYFYDVLNGSGAYIYNNAGELINPGQFIRGLDKYTKQSHEVRFSTPTDNPLRFVGGLFYQRQTHGIEQRYQVKDLADSISVPGWPDTIWLTEQMRVDRDYAIFGELTYDFTEKLSATAGIRFFKARNTLEGFFGFGAGYSSHTGVSQCADPTVPWTGGNNPAPCENLNKEVRESGNTPRVNVTYKFTPDALMYATYSEGFRPGGINRTGALPPYKADYLTNYEIGWKTTWFDNRFRWNGAIFWEDWKDFQYSFLIENGNGLTGIANAGQARIKGIEMDATFAVTSSFIVNGGISYLDTELTENYCGIQGVTSDPCVDPETGDTFAPLAPKGSELPLSPHFKGNVTGRWTFPIGTLDSYAQASVIYNGSRKSDLRTEQQQIVGDMKAYTTVNLSTGVSWGAFSVDAYINNVFSEHASLYRYTECDETVCGVGDPANGAPGIVYSVPNQPMTFGVKFAQRFN